MDGKRFPVVSWNFLSRAGPGPTPLDIQSVTGANRPERVANHSPPSSAKVKNETAVDVGCCDLVRLIAD